MTGNETYTALELPPETINLAHRICDIDTTRKGNAELLLAVVDGPVLRCGRSDDPI